MNCEICEYYSAVVQCTECGLWMCESCALVAPNGYNYCHDCYYIEEK